MKNSIKKVRSEENYIVRIPLSDIKSQKEVILTSTMEKGLEIELNENTIMHLTKTNEYERNFFMSIKELCQLMIKQFEKKKGFKITSIFD